MGRTWPSGLGAGASRVAGLARRRPDAAVAIALVAIVSAVAYVRLWLRPGLADWDIMSFYLPWYAQLGDRLRAGDVPGWNPYVFSGTPFAGNPQSGWGYAPVMLLFAALPAVLAFKVSIWLHLLASALASAFLARLVGLGAVGMLIAGMAYSMTANLAASGCCTLHLQLAPWLPISLIGVELARRRATWPGRLAALGLSAFAFSQAAAAWVGQGAYNAALILGGYLVLRGLSATVGTPVPWRHRLGRTAISGAWVFGLGGMLAAAGLLPRLDVARRTYVGSDAYRDATFPDDFGLPWHQVVEVLLRFGRDIPPYWSPYYVGGAVLILAVVGAGAGWRDRRYRFFLLLTLVVVILPLRPTPVHWVLYALPSYKGIHLHDPGRILAVLPLGTAMLAAIGADRLTRPIPGKTGRALMIGGGSIWALVVLTAASRPWELSVKTWVGALLCLTAVVSPRADAAGRPARLRVMSSRPLGVLPVVLAVAILIDPAVSVATRVTAGPSDNGVLRAAVERNGGADDAGGAGAFLAERQAEDEPFRYLGYVAPDGPAFQAHELFVVPWVQALLINNRAMRLGLHDAQGYDPAQLVTYLSAFSAVNGTGRDYHEALVYASGLGSPVLDLLGVRYVLVSNVDAVRAGQTELDRPPATYREVWRNGEVRVLENTRALPRAWLVHEAVAIGYAGGLAPIADGSVDPRRTVLLAGPLPALEPAAAGIGETVGMTKYEADAVEIEVEAASTGMLVLGDVYDEGWTVSIDGERATLAVADGLLRGVVVAAGTHRVSFRYEPVSLRIGVWTSAAGYAMLLGVVGIAIGRRRLRGARRWAAPPPAA